jgi:DNA-binding transcriptional regulator LsrR (DeoR family)
MLAQIAELYFVRGLNQEQIARKTNYSRSMISRLLSEARDQGIVEIRIHHPLRRAASLERELQSCFGLKHVGVLESSHLSKADSLNRVGTLAAGLIADLIQDGATVGVAWGSALSAVASALRPQPRSGVCVVQMIGSLGTRLPEIDGAELTRCVARAFNARHVTLPAPLLVGDEQTRSGLMRDAHIREVFSLLRRAQLALVGVGSAHPDHSALVKAGFLRARQSLEMQRQAGAVGDVCAIPFDLEGRILDLPISRRVMSVDAPTLVRIPVRLGVAAGEAKVQPVLGALRSGLVNALVTDETVAAGVLRAMNASEP